MDLRRAVFIAACLTVIAAGSAAAGDEDAGGRQHRRRVDFEGKGFLEHRGSVRLNGKAEFPRHPADPLVKAQHGQIM